MLNLSLNEWRLISKSRDINGYKSMCKERLLRDINESESVESKEDFDDAMIKDQKRF